MNTRLTRTTARSRKGASAVEAALMLPLLIIITFGAIDIAQYINSGQVISNASREGARVAAKSNTQTVTEVENAILDYLTNSIPQLTEEELEESLTIQVREVRQSTEEEVTTTTYTQISNGDLSSVESGDAISVSVQFDYSTIRWLRGPGFSDQNIETVCRRE